MPSAANDLILSIDQGTTSSRAILYDPSGRILASAQQEFRQIFPRSGWVEHDGEEIWQSVLETCRAAIGKIDREIHNIIGIGITNQRETSLIWDCESGQPIYNAIVWQDRRTAEFCARMKREGLEAQVQERTGLLLDPYFSASKIAWILDNVDGARERAAAGALAFGTVDSWLIWRLTGGKRHVCDATNACRTLLWNIHTQSWDDALCRYFNVPSALLPEVLDCADEFGDTDAELFGKSIPIRGVAGDQHAAVIGQGCFQPNMIKATYGTGCFVMVNTGLEPIRSKNRLLTTLAYRLGGTCHYALEGSIFVAGAAVQWLRDGLKIIGSAAESNALAEAANPHSHLYFVPAFVGLGAPHWDPEARGAIFGLTRDSGPAEIARATLESAGYQSRELLDAIALDYPGPSAKRQLRVDGGMAASDWTMQFLADCLDIEVERTKNLESTALGAAWLAGHHLSSWPDQEEFAASWQAEQRFQPRLDEKKREELWKGWQNAVMRTKSR